MGQLNLKKKISLCTTNLFCEITTYISIEFYRGVYWAGYLITYWKYAAHVNNNNNGNITDDNKIWIKI